MFVLALFCGNAEIFEGFDVKSVTQHGELLRFDVSDDVGKDSYHHVSQKHRDQAYRD